MAASQTFNLAGEGSTPSGPTDGTKVLAAAFLALNQRREGSSPSGPTAALFDNAATTKHP